MLDESLLVHQEGQVNLLWRTCVFLCPSKDKTNTTHWNMNNGDLPDIYCCCLPRRCLLAVGALSLCSDCLSLGSASLPSCFWLCVGGAIWILSSVIHTLREHRYIFVCLLIIVHSIFQHTRPPDLVCCGQRGLTPQTPRSCHDKNCTPLDSTSTLHHRQLDTALVWVYSSDDLALILLRAISGHG